MTKVTMKLCSRAHVIFVQTLGKESNGAFSKVLFPDSEENHLQCVCTGLRLQSSHAPRNVKYERNKCE